MYLSKLTLNPVPACKQVLRDLASPYELHRTIMRAFPGRQDGGPGRVLFRLETTRPDDPPVVLVQSDKKPDWTPLRELSGYLVSGETKDFELSLHPGHTLRFRLRANPTVKRDGKRHGLLRYEQQCRWLVGKGERHGFRPTDFLAKRQTQMVTHKTSGQGKRTRQAHLIVDFEGVLKVEDPDRFVAAIRSGIGPAKAYGCGLMSVAKA